LISSNNPESVVLFAVDRELKPFVRRFADRKQIAKTRWLCGQGRILVELLGVGKAGAKQKLETLIASGIEPARTIVAGFAGALRTNLHIGDVIAVSEIVDESGGRWTTAWPAERSGRLFTSERMIGDPSEKLALGFQHSADIVDMESSAIAEVCQRHSIPFGCVRVVSDDVLRPLSQQLMGLVESSRVSIGRCFLEVLRSPRFAIELLRLAKATALAADRLALKIDELVRK
jgi:adenosylhomocysteine nucleosidase